MFCKQCGKPIDDGKDLCDECSKTFSGSSNTTNVNSNSSVNTDPNAKSKIAAGLLGIFLGWLGVHNFYLGYTGKAIAQLLISVLSCFTLTFVSSIWGLIEGILILTGSINVDGNGNPLKD